MNNDISVGLESSNLYFLCRTQSGIRTREQDTMAPRGPDDVSEHETASDHESQDDASDSAISDPSNLLNHISGNGDGDGDDVEYHTEEDSEEGEDGTEVQQLEDQPDDPSDSDNDDVAANNPPLLPDELLQPQSTVDSIRAISIPWHRMTRKQKKAQRSRSRQAKKRIWDGLRQETEDTGVLEAGRFAQLKRGIVSMKEKVKSGRIEKKTKPQASGRQQLLEQRKRQIDLSRSELMPVTKKAKTKSKG